MNLPPSIRHSLLPLAILLWGAAQAAQPATTPSFAVLVFTKTTGFHHDSIADGIAALAALGEAHGFSVDATEDAARFTDAALARYRAVVFLNTTGEILDADQKSAFERYIHGGGGFVGIHSASDTEYGWPWYGRLVGAFFASHPAIQPARVLIVDAEHPATRDLPTTWLCTDEWYNFRSNPRSAVHLLATLDETSYVGGTMGADHPLAWCHDFDGGRAWYTAMGHTAESYAEPLFRTHLLGGILTAAGIEPASCPAGK